MKCRIIQFDCAIFFTKEITYYIPSNPPCHPERSGTPGVGANATTKQRRAVEPRPPGGAPAGGISVVPARPRNAPRRPGTRTQGGAWRSVVPLSKRDPACWRPAGGGVRLCGSDWLVRLIFGVRCRYDEVICSEMTRWGSGARYQICLVQMLAPLARPHPALRATFPLEGEGSFGGAWLYVIPLNNGDPAPPRQTNRAKRRGRF